ncbi:hypothetical protein AX16_009732 [Volvariella volvacea WC 439]|nr:hypothetical protein AX16_009732 [Volvariella volvacea WC 439]
MVRRIASQVHQQVSRLMRADFIKQEPAWYKPVLSYPPLPLPPKAPATRTEYDKLPPHRSARSGARNKPSTPKPLPIYYVEDDIRRQFFRDHPFEAFRPTTLVEGQTIASHPRTVTGTAWTRLSQRGRNPTPEDAIKFAVNLYEHHSTPLTQAYAKAVAQFRALRSEHHIATTFAVLEAETLGAVFSHTEIAHAFEKEKRLLSTWERREEMDEGAMAAKKRWKAIVERNDGNTQWSKGQEYVRLWKEGVRPTYSAALTEPVVSPSSAEQIAQSADYMQLRR